MYNTVFILLLLGISIAIHFPKEHRPSLPPSLVASARVTLDESAEKVPNPRKAVPQEEVVEEIVPPKPKHSRSHIYGNTVLMSHDAHDRARRAFVADHLK